MIRATINGEKFNDVVVLRSDIGSVIREGNNENIIWTQNISNGKSLDSGTVEIFNLQDSQLLLDKKTINYQGIATTGVQETADIALVESVGGELAVVPMNIPRSSYYRDTKFQEKQISTKYYLFTDRPLYKPGDSVNFKAIVREDDDAVYSVPSGAAVVKAYLSGEENPVYEKTISFNSDGTVSGTFTLPEYRVGYYRLEIADSNATDRMYWLRTTTSFQVENFRKPEYTLESEARDVEYIKGDIINVSLQGQYFFGKPITNSEANVSVEEVSTYSNPKQLNSIDAIKNNLSYPITEE